MSGVVTAQKSQRQLGSLKGELARISGLIEEGKHRLDAYKVNKKEEKRLLESIPKLQQEERDLLERISRLKGAELEASRGEERQRRKLEKTDTAYKETSEAHGRVAGKKAIAERQVEVLRQDAETIAAGNREKSREEISKTNPALVKANYDLAQVRTDITKAKNELASMATKRENYRKLTRTIEGLKSNERKILIEIGRKNKILREKTTQVDRLDEQLEKKRQAHDEYCAQEMAKIEAEKEALTKREGNLNRMIGWIKNRAGLLSQAKRELEDFRGKDLSHIIIPDVSDL